MQSEGKQQEKEEGSIKQGLPGATLRMFQSQSQPCQLLADVARGWASFIHMVCNVDTVGFIP